MKFNKTKIMLAVLALVLVVAASVGATLAWITDVSAPVVNTFTAGNINIELAETVGDSFKMIPGTSIDKDPKVTVLANSEPCWLFVKVEESDANKFEMIAPTVTAQAATYITYEIADGWTQLVGVNGVYYKENTTAGTAYSVLKDDKVYVPSTVTKAMMDAITSTTQPTLTFTAYACQKVGFSTAAAAWDQVKNLIAST